MAKVLDIPSGQRESMAPRSCRDQAVHNGQPVPFFLRFRLERGPLFHLHIAKGNHTVGEGGEKFGFQPTSQFRPLPAFGKQQNAFSDFRNRDEADEEGERWPGAQPCRSTGIRVRSCGLAQDICIEKIIQSDTLRGRSLFRTRSSSLKSTGQSLSTSQIPFSGSCSRHQSSALTITTNGFPCFVTSWGIPFAAFSATAEKRCLAVWS